MTSRPLLLDRFYPIVPDSIWLAKLAPLGIRTVQLRVKDKPLDRVRAEIAKSIEITRSLGIQLIVNDYWQLALAVDPYYVALGPVYATKLKAMRWAPQGLARVTAWKAAIGDRPLVAIGGITPERADAVVGAGADSLAVITDFFAHAEPDERVKAWVAWSLREA
jgi:thiamine-phosphate pyrophosphorylase